MNEEDEDERAPVNVGCTFVCHPDAADAVAQALRTAVEEVLETFDYGVD
ncbi:hypothetical protein [Streptomyces mirabilis]